MLKIINTKKKDKEDKLVISKILTIINNHYFK